MKFAKFFVVVIAGIWVITALAITPAFAYTESVDQQNTSISPGSSFDIDSGNRTGQKFTPSKNKLTKVELPIVNASGQILLEILDYQTGKTVANAPVKTYSTKINGLSWQPFTFNSASLTPNKVYALVVSTTYGGSPTAWRTSPSGEGSTYLKGNPILYDYGQYDITVEYSDFDFGFKTYGYSTLAYVPGINKPNLSNLNVGSDMGVSASNPQNSDDVSGSPTATVTSSESADDSTLDVRNDSSTSETSTGGSASSGKDIATAEIDANIAIPTLSYAIVNGDIVDSSDKGIVELSAKDILKLIGKSPSDLRTTFFVGDKAFSTKANQTGDWNITIESSSLKSGLYEVEAQAQNEEGKGSKVAKLLDLKMKESASDEALGQLAKYKNYLLYALVALGAILVLGGGAFIWIWKRHKK